MPIKKGIADLTKNDPGMSKEEKFYREYSGFSSPEDDHLGLGIPSFTNAESLFKFMREFYVWILCGYQHKKNPNVKNGIKSINGVELNFEE